VKPSHKSDYCDSPPERYRRRFKNIKKKDLQRKYQENGQEMDAMIKLI
jgi:hypothetical protein